MATAAATSLPRVLAPEVTVASTSPMPVRNVVTCAFAARPGSGAAPTASAACVGAFARSGDDRCTENGGPAARRIALVSDAMSA